LFALTSSASTMPSNLYSGSSIITGTSRCGVFVLLQVTLRHAYVFNNTASLGGGVSLRQAATATLINTTVEANEALRSGGGGFAALQSSLLISNGSRIAWNVARGTGSGVACIDTSKLRMLLPPAGHGGVSQPDNNTLLLMSTVVNSTANGGWGGGVLAESPEVVAAELVAALHGNNASYGADLHAGVAHIELLSQQTVTGFVSRLGVEEGVLHVALRVVGYQGVPSEGALVQAVLGSNQFLAANRTDKAGNVSLSLKVMKSPGNYSLSFVLPEAVNVPVANMSLSIRACMRGEVTPSPDSCLACPSGYYSLDPADAVCSVCVQGAVCPGGSIMLPQPGYWMSAADSNQLHR
jgi:hypothetical protein